MKSRFRVTKDDKVVILTGAGVSAESGIKTFRDENGLWKQWRIEDVANYNAFLNNPELVWEFYRTRYEQLSEVEPNSAHIALTEMEEKLKDNFTLITQNVDGLHKVSGSINVIEMHGSLHRAFCPNCKEKYTMEELNITDTVPLCKKCGGKIRPDIVWFGETPYYLDRINAVMKVCSLFIVIGTSGVVYPAAGLLRMAKSYGASCIGVNLEKPDNYGFLDEFHQGKAGEVMPELIKDLLGE